MDYKYKFNATSFIQPSPQLIMTANSSGSTKSNSSCCIIDAVVEYHQMCSKSYHLRDAVIRHTRIRRYQIVISWWPSPLNLGPDSLKDKTAQQN